jgi:hypothetical protein
MKIQTTHLVNVNVSIHPTAQSLVTVDDHEASVSTKTRHVVIPNHLFDKSSRTDPYPIEPFRNLQIRANNKSSSIIHKNEIVIEDAMSKEPIAVCRMMFSGQKPCKIYTATQNYDGQKASKQKYCTNNGKMIALYTYAEIINSNNNRCNSTINLVLKSGCSKGSSKDGKDDSTYTVSSIRSWSRVVMLNGLQVSMMETMQTAAAKDDYNKSRSRDSICTHLTISPGIDPCLMICLSAICSYFDEITVRE